MSQAAKNREIKQMPAMLESSGMRRWATAIIAVAMLVAGAWSADRASADYLLGSNWRFADVNSPGTEQAPAYPGTKAAWAGTCDLGDGDTSDGGVGSAPPSVSHCIDMGKIEEPYDPDRNGDVWMGGSPPAWRLNPVAQAGAHPDVTVSFFFPRTAEPVAPIGEGELPNPPEGNVKNIIVKLPKGYVGDPLAVPQCPAISAQDVPPSCHPMSQVGLNTIEFYLGPASHGVFALEARDTVTAEFTIASIRNFFNVPITARGRTNGDYGVDTLALLIPSYIPILGTTTTFWGVPWAAGHDIYRADPLVWNAQKHNQMIPPEGLPPEDQQHYDPAWGSIHPFFTNPTQCTGEPLEFTVESDTWQYPVSFGGFWAVAKAPSGVIAGCDRVSFDPSASLRPTTAVADSPSGLDSTLTVPQNNEPPASVPGNPDLAHDPSEDTGAPAYWKTTAGLGTAHLKDVKISLPEGTSFNPAAANGLEGCTASQVGLVSTQPIVFNNDAATCPEVSKLGTVQIDSPLLPDPLFGEVFVAPQSDNPFPGTLTALYLVANDDERGLSVKLAGRIDLDPRTGQISTTFVDNPQLPFGRLTLHLKGGPRAPLNTPPVCGQFENAADMLPWTFPHSGPQPTFHDAFDIAAMPNSLDCVTEPEDRVFVPGFVAGSSDSQAGSYTHLILNVTRDDGHQELSGIDLDAPAGLTANLSETPFCPDDVIASIAAKTGLEESQRPSCPAATQVGVVDTLAGAGPLPLPTPGKLYFAGPYDPDGEGPMGRAPLSVASVVPAIAGGTLDQPAFDLGNVVIRSAVYVDRDDAGVHISSARIPYIVGGVPLRVRRVAVTINKPGFMLNPTSCTETSIGGRISGAADPLDPADDSSVPVSNRFQLGGCSRLRFKPNLSLRLIGGTTRTAHPRLRAELRPRPGDANLASATVTLPHSVFLEQAHLNKICTRVQFAADECPKGSVYGHVRAFTPLMKDPLEGPVRLRSSSNKLPDLVFSLHGLVDLEVAGRIDAVDGRMRIIFDLVPDAPVTKFVLNLKGGKKSLVVNSQNLCGTVNRAKVKLQAHNGKKRRFMPVMRSSCGRKAPHAKHGKRSGHGADKQHGRR